MDLENTLDHIGARVSISGMFGGLAGVGTALHRGTRMGRTVALTAMSCAVCGTVCFTIERIAMYTLISSKNNQQEEQEQAVPQSDVETSSSTMSSQNITSSEVMKLPLQQQQQQQHGKFSLQLPSSLSWDNMLASHAVGGTIGGSMLGILYIGKPFQGAIFFLPLMLLIGTGEKLFQDAKYERIQLQQQNQSIGQQRESDSSQDISEKEDEK